MDPGTYRGDGRMIMRAHVLHSFRAGSPTGGIPRRPFVLDPEAEHSPSRFEIDRVLEGVRYEYGFLLDDEQILEEWAFRYPRGRAALLFQRRGLGLDAATPDLVGV